MIIWNMCNGTSFAELVSSIAGEGEQDAIALRPSSEGLVNELKQAKLLELAQIVYTHVLRRLLRNKTHSN